jgi:superfamily II DNA or RNA helicase
LGRYFAESPKDFLAVATPGAGKTTFALTVASELLSRRIIDRVTVVAPTEHLKTQWAEAAARVGIPLDPSYAGRAGKTSADYVGVAVTYAGVAVNPLAHRIRTERFKTLVILDEVHHAGDALSWGEAVREAFEPARRRLALTGTPFRSDINPIPFVRYEPGPDGIPRSVADYTYGYGHALADHVVRPVLFLAYSGTMQWRTRAGDEVAARLGEPLTKDLTAQALRTALDPAGSWIPSVLEAADKRLSEVRRHMPDAGGLVIATDQDSARAYAKVLTSVAGEKPVVVLSDEKAASKKISEFASSEARWMVAVRMVSEGVDVPRLAVGVYATTTSTNLFFAQAIGRFVRARARGETASIFLPSVPLLLGHASEMEVERDHALGRTISNEDDIFAAEADLLSRAEAGATEVTDEGLLPFEALGSQATFDRVLYDGGEFGHAGEVHVGSEEEMDFLGIPGLLEPDQVRHLLQKRQTDRANLRRRTEPEAEREVTTHERLAVLRRELNSLVAAWHHRTGAPHGATHSALRKELGGPAAAVASADQLAQRIDKIRDWARGA